MKTKRIKSGSIKKQMNQEIGKFPLLLLAVTLLAVAVIIITPSGNRVTVSGSANSNNTPKGNNAPKGGHYNLNILGKDKIMTSDMTGSDRHTIFVPLVGKCSINLYKGDFNVLDGNCTDGIAKFQLPNPDPDNDGVTEYSVYARARGKPGGSSTMETCWTDRSTGETLCSIGPKAVFVREKGGGQFKNVTSELLYIYLDLDGNGVAERYNLFNDALQCENPDDLSQNICFWSYDNKGLRNLQLRFYEVSTDVN